ncbi:putative toxin-antitoxin system toxin component, PIN family [Methylibium sp.]|uniref:putative toxin-antitoxin system toxin component, PIN family n=1 Tax=Methylibium sp. TaxID=2067992 RepID=UPI00286C4446|nr:putative toxin-antitoxin system toxin component, PIN family [Methylibium sp.]
MRAVIDTNVLLSGLLWHGQPHALLEHVRAGTLAMVSSPALLAELSDVIGRAKFDAILVRSKTTRERALSKVRQRCRGGSRVGRAVAGTHPARR